MTEGEALSRACAVAAGDKKAGNIVVLDLRGISTFTDYFVICSATSEPQLKAISSAVREQIRERFGRKPISEDGYPASRDRSPFSGRETRILRAGKSVERCEKPHAAGFILGL